MQKWRNCRNIRKENLNLQLEALTRIADALESLAASVEDALALLCTLVDHQARGDSDD